jgi:hypothetical protein
MARLKIYSGKDLILTTDADSTIHLNPEKDGMTVVVNTPQETVLVHLDRADLKNLAASALALVGKHRELIDGIMG